MKKLISVFLVLSLALSFFACSKENTEVPQENTPQNGTPGSAEENTEVQTGEETEGEVLPQAPQGDFGGADFTVLAACEQWQDFYIAEQTGEALNDAVYERNLTLEEQYNIVLNYRVFNGYTAGMEDVSTALSASVMGGSGDYDMLIGSITYVAPQISAGLLTDLKKLEQINLSQPWWYQYADEQIEIAGRQYLASGAAGLNTVAWSVATFYNKNLAADYGIENLYDTVKSGKWTYDKLKNLSSTVVTDLDGNGVYDINDRVGIVSTNDYMAMEANAMGYFYTELTAEGDRVLKQPDDRLFAINDLLYEIENSNMYISTTGLGADSHENYVIMQTMFANDGALFMIHRLDFATWDTMREMENFGILPSPKYDEEQSSYITPTVNDAVGIPAYVKNTDMSAVVTEAMQYYSALTVKPAYFETVLKRKSTRDEESVEMLEIIGSTCASDFTYVFTRQIGSVIFLIASQNYASDFATNSQAWTEEMAKLVETVKGLPT